MWKKCWDAEIQKMDILNITVPSVIIPEKLASHAEAGYAHPAAGDT